MQNYYFNDTNVYEAGEYEKWLAEKAQEMDIEALEAAHKLIVSGQISELLAQKMIWSFNILKFNSFYV